MKRIPHLLALLLALIACNGDESQSPIPQVLVREEVFTNTVQAQPLQNFPYYIYITGGTKGIIVYREAPNSYIAYDRSCTYRPSDNCHRVDVDQTGLFMVDTCCGSRWDMQGNVIGSPASRPLARYPTVFTPPNRLLITNY